MKISITSNFITSPLSDKITLLILKFAMILSSSFYICYSIPLKRCIIFVDHMHRGGHTRIRNIVKSHIHVNGTQDDT